MPDRLMTIKAVLKKLASDEFSAKVNSASGLSTAIAIIKDDQDVKSVISLCSNGGVWLIGPILDMIKETTLRPVDPNYESPWDSYLSALLIIVNAVDPTSVDLASAFIQRAPQTWWSRQLANQILSGNSIKEPGFDTNEEKITMRYSSVLAHVRKPDWIYKDSLNVTSDAIYPPTMPWKNWNISRPVHQYTIWKNVMDSSVGIALHEQGFLERMPVIIGVNSDTREAA